MVDLFGEYRHKVDAKGRLSLPAKFRKELSDDLVVTRDPFDECLYVFEPEGHNEWVASFFEGEGGFDQRNRQHISRRRELKRRAIDTEVDGSGRINIPANQRQAVGIDKEVVIIGNTGYFEIWDAKRWESQCDEVDLTSMFTS